MYSNETNYWFRRSRSRRQVLAGFGAAAIGGSVAALAGCGGGSSSNSASPTSAGTPPGSSTPQTSPTSLVTARRGGTFTTPNQFVQADFFDVHQTNSSGVQALAQYTHDGLFLIDEAQEGDFQIKPMVVASWEQPDPLTLVLKLRQDVKFANIPPVNGRKLTSKDVVFNLNRIATKDPRFIRQSWFQDVDHYETPDDYTVRIVTKKPSAALLFLLAHPWTLLVSPEQVDQDGAQLKSLVGSGPYILKSIQIGTQADMHRNPDYWMQGKPYIDSWKWVNIADTASRMAAFRGNQLDYTDVPQDVLTKFRGENADAKEIHVGTVGILLIGFNVRKAPYNDVRVRQAIANAVDIDGWIQVILAGDGRRTGPMSAAFRQWALPKEKLLYPKQDIKAAKDLLKAAGLENGFTLKTFSISSLPNWFNEAVQMKEDLKQVNINVEIEQVTIADYVRRLFGTHEFDVVNGADFASEDPANLMDRYMTGGSANWSGYSNKQVDDLFAQQSVQLDYNARRATVDQLQQVMMQDVASHFVMIQGGHYFHHPNIQNFRLSPMNGTAERWDAREAFFSA